MERIKGIEPLTKEWKSFVLPLNYIRIMLFMKFFRYRNLVYLSLLLFLSYDLSRPIYPTKLGVEEIKILEKLKYLTMKLHWR